MHGGAVPSLQRLVVLLALLVAVSTGKDPASPTEEELKESWDFSGTWRDGKDRKGPSQKETKASAHHLLHNAGGASGSLAIPAQVNVILVGFDGDGGYHYNLDAGALQDLLAARFPATTPAVLSTQQSTLVRHLLKYRVMHAPKSAMRTLEAIMRARLRQTGEVAAAAPGSGNRVPLFEVDASEVEIGFDAVYASVLQGDADAFDRPSPMLSPLSTNDSAIIITNFDKLRIDPRLPSPPDDPEASASLTESWDAGDLTAEQLRLQEGDYLYRYSYKSAGASATLVAHQRYAVIDISAGPCTFGPAAARQPSGAPVGAVTPLSVPRLQAVLRRSAQAVERQPPGSLRTKALQEAISVRDSVFRGELATLVYGAVQHVIVPDVQSEEPALHHAKRIMMPLVVLRDHDDFDPVASDGASAGGGGHPGDLSTLWGPRRRLDKAAVNALAQSMLPGGRELVMPTVSLFLHEHRQLATALAKATRPGSKDRGPPEVDGEALVDEFRRAADALTMGMWNEMEAEAGEHPGPAGAAEAMLEGTHLVPVFVLSLKAAPQGLSMGGGTFVVAHEGVVIVLQVAQKSFTGHWANGGPLLSDGLDVTRHVAAGVAQALGGLVPPYVRFSAAHGSAAGDWLWGVGHHPFGPYSNCSGLSLLLVDAAHRNAMLSRASVALGHIHATLELLEEFADEYMAVPPMPGVRGYLEEEDMRKATRARIPWWDSLYRGARRPHPPLPHATVKNLEQNLDALEAAFVTLAQRLWVHDYSGADSQSAQLQARALSLRKWAAAELQAAREDLGCCHLAHEVPRKLPPVVIYGLLLLGFAGAYGAVMRVSAMAQQRKDSVLAGRTRDDSQSY